MSRIVYINKNNQILNPKKFKKLNGNKNLSKSQLRLLGLKKIKVTSEQANNGFIQTMVEGIKN